MTSLSTVYTSALLDSGATGLFIDKKFCVKNKIETIALEVPIPVHNVDGSQNDNGLITEEAHMLLRIGDHTESACLAVTNLGRQTVIIGHSWLQHHNPEVDWSNGKIMLSRCPSSCYPASQSANTDVNSIELEEGDAIFGVSLPANYTPEAANIGVTQTPSQRMAQDAHIPEDHPLPALVPSHYLDFSDVFSKEGFAHLPPRKAWDHAINLVPNAPLPKGKTFPLLLPEQKELDAFLHENLANGRIQPSKSPVGAPVFFVKKKDGSLRLVQDYRKLNEITIKNSYPLPLISDVLARLRNAQYFSMLDLRWGFNNVRIKKGDEWKAAFSTNWGLFEPLVMFFGLCNSPATFQTMMNDILRRFIDKNVAICYMDNILVFTETLKEHRSVVRDILLTLRRHKLFLKPEKCMFEKSSVNYLGLVISRGCVSMDPVKVRGVSEWPPPKKVKDVQSFLGFVNFYHQFIKNFAEIARPLHAVDGK